MSSIPATTNALQDISEGNQPLPDEFGASDPRQDDQEQSLAALFDKYGYDEFLGFKGYDRLDRITQLILSAANCRTWRNADKFVAPGNDCYAGTYAVADIIKP